VRIKSLPTRRNNATMVYSEEHPRCRWTRASQPAQMKCFLSVKPTLVCGYTLTLYKAPQMYGN
jgi:hypothetical protein